MKKNLFILYYCIFAVFPILAQPNANVQKSIYFTSGDFNLTETSKTTLLDIIQEVKNAGDYEIDIFAYTDTDGNRTYNQQLSENRAKSVNDFLMQNGVFLEKTETFSSGEDKIENEQQNEDLKAKNRRVDVVVKVQFFADLPSFMNVVQQRDEQFFSVANDEETILEAAKGTVILVPANAFVFKDGKEPSGEIKIKIREIYDYSDMIFNELHTYSGDKILETGGMLYIEASNEGQELLIKEGENIKVAFPVKKVKNDMELFYGSQHNNGKMKDWVATKQKASEKSIQQLVCYKIDRTELKKIKLPKEKAIEKLSMPKIESSIFAPTMPIHPKTNYVNSVEKPTILTQNRNDFSRKERKEYDKILEDYEKKVAQNQLLEKNYQKRTEQYEVAIKKYNEVTLPKYQAEKNIYDAKIQQRIDEVSKYLVAHAEKQAIGDLAKARVKHIKKCINSESNIAYNIKLPDCTANFVGDKAYSFWEMLYIKAIGDEKSFEKIARENLNLYPFLSKELQELYKNYLPQNEPFFNYDRLLHFRKESIAKDTKLDIVFKDLEFQQDSMRDYKRIKALENSIAGGTVTNRGLSQYVFSINKLGWINCDRFQKIPESEKMLVSLDVKKPNSNETLYMTFKNIKSAVKLHSSQKESSIFHSDGAVPRNEPVTLVAIKIENGKPFIAKVETTPEKANYNLLAYQPINNISELRKTLKDL